jgi:hypothetical protein
MAACRERRFLGRAQRSRNPEVADFHGAVRVNEAIRGFDIAVKDAGRFGRLERGDELQRRVDRRCGRQRAVSFEPRHRAPDDDHVIPQGPDLRRQELVPAAEQVERVANHGGEPLATGPREECFVRSPTEACRIRMSTRRPLRTPR